MIIVDASNILIGTAYSVIEHLDDFDENMFRQSLLFKLGNIKKKFAKDYGKFIIAVDDKKNPYWRTDFFPHYKCRRKEQNAKKREVSDIDWYSVFNVSIPKILKEIDEYMPWMVIEVAGCEADDIIGTLTLSTYEPVVIVSRDHDFKQLQFKDNVKQFDPANGNWVVEKNPKKYLQEHIIRGDSGDDIPNILSPEDSFFTKTRQNSVFKKNLDKWLGKDIKEFAETTEMIDRYKFNKKLIDLKEIPEDIKERILAEYDRTHTGHNSMVFDYFVDNNLVDLLDSIQIYMEK